MNRLKKLSTALLCGSMIASVIFGSTGCSFLDKSPEQILDVSDSFCKAICDKKAKNAAKFVTEDDAQDYFDWYFCFNADTDTPVIETIGDNISYEIDEDSVKGSKKDGEGSIDVVFTLIDYDKVASEGEFENASELASAIEASKDTKDIEITLELEYTGDKDNPWLIDNYEEVMETLYEFTSYEPEYDVDFASMVTGSFLEASSDDFTNIISIAIEVDFSEDLIEYNLYASFDFYYNGTLVTTRYVPINSDYIRDILCVSDGYDFIEDEYLPEGFYEIEVYLDDGTVLADESAEVYRLAPTPTPTPTPETGDEMDCSFAASFFRDEGARIEPEADVLGITECEWVRSELDENGNDIEAESYAADDIHFFGYVVNTPDQHPFECEVTYLEDPHSPLSAVDYGEPIDYMSENQQYSDGTWGFAILIPDPMPGIYIMSISCDEVTTAEYGNDIILDIIELT